MFELARASAHGIVQGGAAEVGGGEFRDGFLGGSVGSFGGHLLEGSVGSTMLGDINMNEVIAAAVVGGTAAEIGGGKFANGAYSAAFSSLVNQQAQANRQSKAEGGQEKHWSDGLSDDEITARLRAELEAVGGTEADHSLSILDSENVELLIVDGPFTHRNHKGQNLDGLAETTPGVHPSDPTDRIILGGRVAVNKRLSFDEFVATFVHEAHHVSLANYDYIKANSVMSEVGPYSAEERFRIRAGYKSANPAFRKNGNVYERGIEKWVRETHPKLK